MASFLDPNANLWVSSYSMLPHVVYPYQTFYYLQPHVVLLQQPIQIYSINPTAPLHAPFPNPYYVFQQPQLVDNSNWDGGFDQQETKLPNFGFEVTCTTQYHKKHFQENPEVPNIDYEEKRVETFTAQYHNKDIQQDPKVPKFDFVKKEQKVQNPGFGFEVTGTTAQYHKKKGYFRYSTPPRLRKIVGPPTLTKVWKVKRNAEIKDGNAENVPNLADEMKTSLMIRNLPNQLRREDLLRFLDIYCMNHQLEYDFVYLPMDFLRHHNLGYAFVNFTTSCGAAKFMSLLDGYKWNDAQSLLHVKSSKKVCKMNWATLQGKEEFVKHFQQSKFCCEEKEYLPVVFSPPRNGSTCLSSPTTIGKFVDVPTIRRR